MKSTLKNISRSTGFAAPLGLLAFVALIGILLAITLDSPTRNVSAAAPTVAEGGAGDGMSAQDQDADFIYGPGEERDVDLGVSLTLNDDCPWDCADGGNGDVGITDFLKLLADWSLPSTCDFDGGGVGITDFLKLLANWGPCP